VTVVFDSWAVLRFLVDEGGAARRVDELLTEERPTMSWTNLGEVSYILSRAALQPAAEETVRDPRQGA
jgi:hypothetical protein